MKKRILSIMMVIALVLMVIPAVSAADAEVTYSTDGGATWKEDSLLNALWNSYGNGGTIDIKLLRNNKTLRERKSD